MARPFTVAQRQDAAGATHITWILMQIADPDGTFREITNFQGLDWFVSARWGGERDRGFEVGSVVLHRYDAGTNISLSPEIGASPANRNAAAAYAPFLKVGRRIKWQTVVKPAGVVPVAGDYMPAFDGYIAQLGGDEETIEINVVDLGGPLQRVQIDAKTRYGAGGAGTLLENAIQAMLNDWADVPPVVYMPAAVGRVVGLFDVEPGSLLEAIRAVAAQGGQDFRYKWDAVGVLRPTYYTPNRADISTQAVVDWLDPGEYLKASPLEVDIASIRNKAIVRYVDGATGAPGVQSYTDDVSRVAYGRQTVEITREKTSTINTAAKALALATTIVTDLAVPQADHEIEALYYPWVEVNDVMGCRADGVYYDSDQKFAVASYEHSIANGEGRTKFKVSGRVSGQYRIWIRAGGGGIGGRAPGEYVSPIVLESTSRTSIAGTPSGVLDLTVYDPAAAITTVEFRTRSGNAGAWSPWSADAAPYQAAVALVPGESSAIAYRITGTRADGSVDVLRATDVEFTADNPAAGATVEVRTRLVSSTTTQVVIAVDVIAPPTVSGSPTVQLVALTGSASLAAGAAVGVSVASGSQWTFNRGAAIGGYGQAQFRGALAGAASDDDYIEIPEQGRDTVALSVRAQPVTPTATTSPVDLVVTDPLGDAAVATITLTYTGLASVLVAGVSRASGYQFTLAPGTTVRIEPTRPVFGNPTGRLELLATKTGRVQDTDSVDVIPQDRDTILPTGYAVTTENGLTATTTLTVYDPQARRTKVDFAYGYANLPLVAPTIVAPNGSGQFVYAAPLVEKQPTRIVWRVWGTMPDGSEQVLDSGLIRSGIGARPFIIDILWTLTDEGRLQLTVKGDSDTTLIRVLVRRNAEPIEDDVRTAGASLAGRTVAYEYDTLLSPGDRWYVGAIAYNQNVADPVDGSLPGYASTLATATDVWTGPSANAATVLVGRSVVSEKEITFDQIAFGKMTALVEVWVQEYRTDPGSVSSVVGSGWRPPGAPVRVAGGAVTVPVSVGGNYVVVSFAAVDDRSRRGSGQSAALGVHAGVVTLKVQSASVAVARPNAPQALALASVGLTNDGVVLSITNAGGAPLPTSFRIFRDGVAVADIAVTVGAGAIQQYTDAGRSPNTTYTYQVYGMSATGILSAIGSPQQQITLGAGQVPTPAIDVGPWNEDDAGFPIYITPGANTPPGTQWQIEHSTTVDTAGAPGAFTVSATTGATVFLHLHNAIITGPRKDWIRVTGVLASYNNSTYSNVSSVIIPSSKYLG